MDSSAERGAGSPAHRSQQEVVAELGQRALETDDLDRLFGEAATAVASTLDVSYCAVLESRSDEEALLRQGTGWPTDALGSETVRTDAGSLHGAALRSPEPVVVEDVAEAAYEPATLLADHDVGGGVAVVVGSVDDPWGVLGAYAGAPRAFEESEATFVRSVANVLASAIANRRARTEVEEIYGRISDAFFALDEDWNFTYLNERAHELINPEGRTLVGESIWEQFPAAAERAFEEQYEHAMYEQETVTFEEYYPEPLDTWFEVRAYPSETGLSVYFRDVTERKRRERQLEQSEQRYRTLAESFPNGIVTLFDSDCRYTLAAGRAFEDLPVSEDDLRGATPSEAWGEAVGDALEPAMAAAFDGEERAVEVAYAGREWVVHAVPVSDEDGEVFAGMTMAQDVTERTERERELAKYRTIVETVDDGIYVKDADGEFTMVNEAYTELTGYDREELLGEHASLVVDEATIQAAREQHATADDGDSTVEAEIQTADGDAVPTEGTFSTLETADGRQLEVGVVRDVSERIQQRRRIEESERRYRTLVEQFPDGAVALYDENLEYRAIGGQLLEEQGIDREDRIGQRIPDIYPEDVVEQVLPHYEAALGGEVRDFEIEYHGRHLSATVLPVRDATDDVFAGMVVIRDVTERREAQRELRESEARFRMLAENLEAVVWMASADADEFRYVNPAVEDVWGIDRETLYDDPLAFLDVVHPDDHERVTEAFAALPETEFDEEFRIDHPERGRRWLHARGARVHDEDAELVRTIGIGEDVTDRKRRERQLEESERRYRTLAENFPSGAVSVYDHDLQFTLARGSLMGDVLPGREAVEGRTVEEVYPPEIVEDLAPLLRDALEEGTTDSDRFEFADRHWRVWATPLRDAEGEVFAGLSFAQDVTEQVERERQLEELVEKLEESNERLEQFAYAASHDLQEPLRMVSSYLQLVDRRYADELDEDGREFIDYAVDGADRMREMIEGLLEYSRVETEGEPMTAVDLDAVVEDVLADLQLQIVETDADVAVDSLPTVEGDPSQLRQLFQNLLDNALTYAGEEPPVIEVDAERAGDWWRVSVSDEGVGIPPEERDSIFEVFQRLHSREEYAGTGIGLALCERIVQRHGGDIWVDSTVDEGSTFSFTLPAAEGGRDE